MAQYAQFKVVYRAEMLTDGHLLSDDALHCRKLLHCLAKISFVCVSGSEKYEHNCPNVQVNTTVQKSLYLVSKEPDLLAIL